MTEPPKQAVRACEYCQRAHKKCDDERPCQRCMRLGIGDRCCNGPVRKRGRPSSKLGGQYALSVGEREFIVKYGGDVTGQTPAFSIDVRKPKKPKLDDDEALGVSSTMLPLTSVSENEVPISISAPPSVGVSSSHSPHSEAHPHSSHGGVSGWMAGSIPPFPEFGGVPDSSYPLRPKSRWGAPSAIRLTRYSPDDRTSWLPSMQLPWRGISGISPPSVNTGAHLSAFPPPQFTSSSTPVGPSLLPGSHDSHGPPPPPSGIQPGSSLDLKQLGITDESLKVCPSCRMGEHTAPTIDRRLSCSCHRDALALVASTFSSWAFTDSMIPVFIWREPQPGERDHRPLVLANKEFARLVEIDMELINTGKEYGNLQAFSFMQDSEKALSVHRRFLRQRKSSYTWPHSIVQSSSGNVIPVLIQCNIVRSRGGELPQFSVGHIITMSCMVSVDEAEFNAFQTTLISERSKHIDAAHKDTHSM